MNRNQVYRDMETKLGIVPEFFKTLPDETLQLEWELMQRVQMDAGAIPNKYRELIGIGISATSRCRYCIVFHTEMARLFGATDAEIEDAVHYAKSSAGWSAYLNGMQTDLEQFTRDVKQVVEFVGAQMASRAQETDLSLEESLH
jgi:AhpD family alkylhydroperoxidase